MEINFHLYYALGFTKGSEKFKKGKEKQQKQNQSGLTELFVFDATLVPN